MNMRKTVFAVIAAMAMAAAFAQGKNAIAVPAPKGVNLGDGADWIPLFIQGIITTNFQQYSGLTVIDRQNADMVKAEQRLSEGAEFDEKNAIELGKMTSAKLIITGNIVAKSASYALTFSITDAESGETKATASVPDCPRSDLEDGTAANKISYDLMAGYGIALGDDTRVKLTRTATLMTSETSAQMSVAKGIAAEKGGSNIEALTYYIQAKKNDKNLAEAASRMAGMTTVVTGGNFGANAKNLIKLRNDWDKLLLEAAGLIAANPPEFELRYFTDIEPLELTEKDYENGTMSFRMGAPYLMQISGEENAKIAGELMNAMQQIEQSKNWGSKMNGFPWTYANDIPDNHWFKWFKDAKAENYSFSVSLLDANKKVIAKKPYTLSVAYGRKFTNFKISSDNKARYGDGLPSLTISDVPVGNADTDKIYISVENAGSQKISVLPTDALPFDKAISVLEAGSHNGTVKIGGFFQGDSLSYIASAIKSNKKPVALDLSELYDVTEITRERFDGCTSLTSIILPKNVTKIAEYAFWYRKSLANVTIPAGVTTIGHNAFEGCTSLASVTIPAGVTTIDERTFSGCTSLASVTIPAGVTTIGHNAFDGCKSLANVTIPAGVTTIGNSAFRGCTSLANVTIPAGVTTIGNSAFRGCTSLANVTIPAGVTTIGYNAFEGCKSLASVTIPAGVTTIGGEAFSECTSLASVTIPAGVTKINEMTFYGCTSLVSVTIPAGVTKIDKMAFDGCTSLASVTIPAGVTTIGERAFRGCTSLASVTIPEGVTGIWFETFKGCPKLKEVRYGGTTKQWKLIEKYSYAFDNGVIVHCTDGDIAWNAKN